MNRIHRQYCSFKYGRLPYVYSPDIDGPYKPYVRLYLFTNDNLKLTIKFSHLSLQAPENFNLTMDVISNSIISSSAHFYIIRPAPNRDKK